MIATAVAIYDKVAGLWNQPMFMVSRGAAMRGFRDEINRVAENNQFNKHPQDYDLYFVGTFDDATAEFALPAAPELIVCGKDCVEVKQ